MTQTTIIANWKMHAPALPVWTQAVTVACTNDAVEVVLCPPFTQLAAAQMVLTNTPIQLGGQDCHGEDKGAFTGEISADMLKRSGCGYVIVGHSERRLYHGETNAQIKAKASAALRHGLTPIICIGESEAEYKDKRTQAVLARQLDESVPEGDIIIAYEPVWAIGSGHTPCPDEVGAIHAGIKKRLHKPAPVVYGGSVKPDNARDFLSVDGVDGLLVGGASLDGISFAQIVAAAS